MEANIVDLDFVKRSDTYNLTLGGISNGIQYGVDNPMYGKIPNNAKPLVAEHSSGEVVYAPSLREMSNTLGIARGNVRNLLRKGIRGRRGWIVRANT